MSGKIFISHASKDADLAVLLRDSLILGDVPKSRIFYSSERSTGIPSGQNVDQYLRQTLNEAVVVIELITTRFLSRSYCLMELGGAWAMGKVTLPIVIPPLTRQETVGAIGNVQLNTLNENGDVDALMDELYDMLSDHAGVRLTASSWGYAASKFKESLPAVMKKLATEEASSPATGEPSTLVTPEDPNPKRASGHEEVREGGLQAFNFSDITGRFSTEVHGEVANESQRPKTATLKCTFFDSASRIVGTASGLVNAVAPGSSKTFTLTSVQPISDYARYAVQFETVFDSD